ncbi:hypothetical protein SAMN05444422_10231 [Halobiforma haloterrestris]|uniref:LexA-binding, inner membrane-associated hydrolase n=1 Tax=Natronobacterium haloterrestre TaxID=148448 RepID=A0A1I1E2J9_NATHA|nr:hypothetical protein [Halobiforma haloterrestris]SFB79170.1 hypothetical protein SAMN05444422_10231 [Halobiforma haloterrestris]
MMATTHVFVALVAVAPFAVVAPEFALPLSIGAVLGGLAPDLDVLFDHRRTLHFPVAGFPSALVAGAIALETRSPTAVGLAAFALGAWLHAGSDAIGAGPELDPWNNSSDRAVYDHVRGRWIRPRRWIRYDGAPEDAGLAVSLGVASLFVFDGWMTPVVVAGVAISLCYALFRRRIAEWA